MAFSSYLAATKRLIFDGSIASDSTDLRLLFTESNNKTITFPDATDTIICKNTTDALTNKTIIDSTNVVSASRLRTITGDVIISGSISPSNGQVLIASDNTTASWQTFVGSQGPQGIQGVQGPQGIQGAQGVQISLTYFHVETVASTSTSSTTDVLMASMSVTPTISGSYLVMWEGTPTNTLGTTTISIYVNGSQIANTIRAGVTSLKSVIIWTAGAIELRYRTNLGTTTVTGRSFTVLRVE